MLPYISSPSLIGFHCPLVSFSLFLGIFLILMPSFPLFHHYPQYSSLLFQLHGHHFHHPIIICYHHSNYPIIVPIILSPCHRHVVLIIPLLASSTPVAIPIIIHCSHSHVCNHIILVYFLHHSSQIGMSHSEPKFLLGHSYSICLVGFETFQGHLSDVSLRRNIGNSSNNSHASILATSLWTFCKLHALKSNWSIKLICSFVLDSMNHLLLNSPLHSKEHYLRCKHSWVFFEPLMTYVSHILAS
jgi:hypothetical protein